MEMVGRISGSRISKWPQQWERIWFEGDDDDDNDDDDGDGGDDGDNDEDGWTN